MKAQFDFNITKVVETDGIALMHTEWTVSQPRPIDVHAIEVARRQSDGTWRWLIGDPFTVRRAGAMSLEWATIRVLRTTRHPR